MKRFIVILLTTLSIFRTYAQHYSWQKLETEKYQGKQDDIYFVDENRGWYINGYGKIFNTTNGGKTWKMQLEKKGTFFRCIAFTDSLTGFAGTVGTGYFPNVTDTIPLYKTIDGGRNWQPVRYSGPYVKGLCALDVVKEQYINHGEIGYKYHIYGVGRVGTPANFMVSHDNGNTFTSMPMTPYCAALYDIKMFNTKEGFACASNNGDVTKSNARIIQTKDGGKTWNTVYESERPYEISWKLSFPTAKIGYATIQSYNPDSMQVTQRFVKTTNGGKNWKEYVLTENFKDRPFGVGFLDEKQGFIGTMKTGYQTSDGGKSWKRTDLGMACNKIRIVKKPDGTFYGYAIGVNVFKLKAT